LLSLPVGTEMFHFPTLPPPALCVQAGATGHYACQVSPFGHPRIKVWLPTPRGLSQAPTSFFGSWCQGIRRVPLLTWQLQMLASTMQFSRYGRSRRPNRRVPRHSAPDPELNSAVPPERGRSAGRRSWPRGVPKRPFPQDPTACSAWTPSGSPFLPQGGCTSLSRPGPRAE
jgi:hypothetical protein